MKARKDYYNDLIINKDIVQRLKSLDRIPDIYELVLLNYSRYDSIENKLCVFKELINESWIEGVDEIPHNQNETFDRYIRYITDLYKSGLKALNNSNDYIYIITSMNDMSCFNPYIPNKYPRDPRIDDDSVFKSCNNIDHLNQVIYNETMTNICTVVAINRNTGFAEYKYKYGLLYNGKVEVYQISDNYFWGKNLFEYKLDYAFPYDNDTELYIYYPFMSEKIPIGKSYIEVEDNNVYYAWADIWGKGINLSYTNFVGTNMAVYSCIFQ